MPDCFDMPDWCLSACYPLDDRQIPQHPFQQVLCFREASSDELRSPIALDQYGAQGWSEIGHGKYTHCCPVSPHGFTPGHKPPVHDDPVIIALTEAIPQRGGGDLWPQFLFLGRRDRSDQYPEWRVSLPRWMARRVPVERAWVRVLPYQVLWLPAPRYKKTPVAAGG